MSNKPAPTSVATCGRPWGHASKQHARAMELEMGWGLGGCLVARMIVERVGASERLYSVLSCKRLAENRLVMLGLLLSWCPSETASVGYNVRRSLTREFCDREPDTPRCLSRELQVRQKNAIGVARAACFRAACVGADERRLRGCGRTTATCGHAATCARDATRHRAERNRATACREAAVCSHWAATAPMAR